MKIHPFIFSSVSIALCFIVSSETPSEIWKITDLKVIIHPHIFAENKWKQSPQRLVDPTDANTKKEICRSVFTTSFFKVERNEDWVDLDEKKNFEKLKELEPYLFNSIYPNIKEEYENPTRERLFFMNSSQNSGTHRFVFRCLVREHFPYIQVTDYFVSQAHYIHFPELNVIGVVGRFVFSGKSWILTAFAADSTGMGREFEIDIKDSHILQDFMQNKDKFRWTDDEENAGLQTPPLQEPFSPRLAWERLYNSWLGSREDSEGPVGEYKNSPRSESSLSWTGLIKTFSKSETSEVNASSSVENKGDDSMGSPRLTWTSWIKMFSKSETSEQNANLLESSAVENRGIENVTNVRHKLVRGRLSKGDLSNILLKKKSIPGLLELPTKDIRRLRHKLVRGRLTREDLKTHQKLDSLESSAGESRDVENVDSLHRKLVTWVDWNTFFRKDNGGQKPASLVENSSIEDVQTRESESKRLTRSKNIVGDPEALLSQPFAKDDNNVENLDNQKHDLDNARPWFDIYNYFFKSKNYNWKHDLWLKLPPTEGRNIETSDTSHHKLNKESGLTENEVSNQEVSHLESPAAKDGVENEDSSEGKRDKEKDFTKSRTDDQERAAKDKGIENEDSSEGKLDKEKDLTKSRTGEQETAAKDKGIENDNSPEGKLDKEKDLTNSRTGDQETSAKDKGIEEDDRPEGKLDKKKDLTKSRTGDQETAVKDKTIENEQESPHHKVLNRSESNIVGNSEAVLVPSPTKDQTNVGTSNSLQHKLIGGRLTWDDMYNILFRQKLNVLRLPAAESRDVEKDNNTSRKPDKGKQIQTDLTEIKAPDQEASSSEPPAAENADNTNTGNMNSLYHMLVRGQLTWNDFYSTLFKKEDKQKPNLLEAPTIQPDNDGLLRGSLIDKLSKGKEDSQNASSAENDNSLRHKLFGWGDLYTRLFRKTDDNQKVYEAKDLNVENVQESPDRERLTHATLVSELPGNITSEQELLTADDMSFESGDSPLREPVRRLTLSNFISRDQDSRLLELPAESDRNVENVDRPPHKPIRKRRIWANLYKKFFKKKDDNKNPSLSVEILGAEEENGVNKTVGRKVTCWSGYNYCFKRKKKRLESKNVKILKDHSSDEDT